MTLNDVIVNFSHIKRENILSDWHWLIGENELPIMITAMEDVV